MQNYVFLPEEGRRRRLGRSLTSICKTETTRQWPAQQPASASESQPALRASHTDPAAQARAARELLTARTTTDWWTAAGGGRRAEAAAASGACWNAWCTEKFNFDLYCIEVETFRGLQTPRRNQVLPRYFHRSMCFLQPGSQRVGVDSVRTSHLGTIKGNQK